MGWRRWLLGLAVLVPGPAAWGAPVPVVGCAAVGMSGPAAAPSPLPAAPVVAGAAAEGLAYYAAPGLAVLAPAGWHCLEIYGSGGASLIVAPRAFVGADYPGENNLAGPVVELSWLSGEDSGREDVARVLARLFPAEVGRVRAVEREDVPYGPVQHFPRGPFAGDVVRVRSRTVVRFTTPPGRVGMGTFESCLRPDGDEIRGTAVWVWRNGVDNVLLLDVRLPAGWGGVGGVIEREVEEGNG